VDEQRNFKTLISTEVKYGRNNKRRRDERRGEDGLTVRERALKENMEVYQNY